LAKYIRNKKVALFGNAKSVLRKERDIDSKYDIICRINLGFVKGNEKYIGSRTDILFLSTPIKDSVLKQINPKIIIWCTPKHEKMTPYIKEHSLKYNKLMWQCLYNSLQARPSTGMMAIDILRGLAFSRLDIYGFDHWKSETWYTNRNNPCHHNPQVEKTAINYIINTSKGRIKKK
jgi:hypothetical protein